MQLDKTVSTYILNRFFQIRNATITTIVSNARPAAIAGTTIIARVSSPLLADTVKSYALEYYIAI